MKIAGTLELAAAALGLCARPSNAFVPSAPRHPFLRHAPERPVSATVRPPTRRPATADPVPVDAPFSLPVPPGTNPLGRVTIVVPSDPSAVCASGTYGKSSPVSDSPPLVRAVARHAARKINDAEQGVAASVVPACDFVAPAPGDGLPSAVIALQLTAAADCAAVGAFFFADISQSLQEPVCAFALDCAAPLRYEEKFPLYESSQPLAGRVGSFVSFVPPLVSLLPWTDNASDKRLHDLMLTQFEAHTAEGFAYGILFFVHHFARRAGKSVAWVEHSIDATWEKGPVQNAQEIYKMVDKCGDCIQECLQDEQCKACVEALNKVDTRDQVASYRTIVSYESEILKNFSYCILTQNNVFGCDADVPERPAVAVGTWGGEPITRESARQILVAHLDDGDAPAMSKKTPVSWKVAAGANVAYDQFPDQNQLFYAAATGTGMWYDPVFRVETLDGRQVWCKRHYKVRELKEPGTFRLTVLDNGVASDERWTIVGAAADLSWVVFHYAGAARAVGQRYLGGLVCTPDGTMPDAAVCEGEIWPVLARAQIEPWDLFVVDNSGGEDVGPAPLDFYRKDVLKKKEEMRTANVNV